MSAATVVLIVGISPVMTAFPFREYSEIEELASRVLESSAGSRAIGVMAWR
jgi:hypothetical protein